MIFKKINFKLISIILLFFCTQHIKCKRVEKRSIMQDLMSNLMQIIDPKSNQKPNMPYKIIKSEVVDGKVQKYFYTVPNVDDDKIKDLNNAIKLLSIQSMLNRHYKNQYRKHKMMKELEQLSKGNENNDKFKKLNEHTMKKYKYINNYNNHRFNKEMLKLQKQAQKLIDNSPELFKSVQDHHFLVQNPQENLETMPEFYTNSHGPEQTLRSKHKHEQSGQETPQVFLLSPNEIPAEPHKYPHESSPSHLKYITSGKPNYSPDHLKYFSLPVSKDPFTRVQLPQSSGLLPQRYNPKELTYSKPYLGPKDIPWSMKQKAPEVFLPSRQGVPWSVVPLPPPLTTLNMGASNTEYTWALGDLPPPLGENSFTRPNADMNSYWALKPLPPPMQSPISSRDMKTSASNINCKNNEDVTLETSSFPYVINTYIKNSVLKTDISNENYDDPHITQESTHKTYTIDTRNNNDSKRKDKEDNQQMKQESTMQQYSINPILLQQYQRYNNQQKSMVKVANSTQNNEGAKQKDQTNNKTKKQEQVQSSTNQKESNVTSPTTFTRKYQPKNQNKQFNPEQSQNFNVNQEKILQQRQQQLKQFYEKQKQQRQLIRNNNKNIMPETKNVQDGGGRSYMFNSKLNTQTAIPIDVAIPIEESDWIPIQPKYKMSNLNGNVKYQHSFVDDEVKNPTSNVDVMLVFSNETKVKKSEDTPKLDAQESEKSYSEDKTKKHQETRRQFSNDEIQNVDETIRQLTYNKPIYDVPIINDQNPINSEKTVVIEVVNSDVLKGNEKENSVEDIEVSESNTLPVKVRFENRTKSHANKEKHSSNGEHVSPVRTYERVKVKTKRKKYENVENLNQNETFVNQTKQIENNITSTNNPLLNPVNVTEVTDNVLINNSTSSIFTEKTKEKDDTLANINESQSLKNTEDISNNFNESIPIAQPNKDRELEVLSLVADEIQTDDKNIQIQPTEEGKDFLMHTPEFLALSEDKFEQSEEYEPSSSNIKELIANRSKIIRPFFRSKQNLSLTTTTTSTTTTTTTTTTIKPVVVKPARYIPELVKDQKFEESKTHNNYDDYDDQLSFENIRAAQEFNFPKTDVSYSVNLPKSSQSVYKSVSNERLVDANRKHSTRNTYRGGNRHRHGPPNRQRDQSDYENREEQTYVTPTYDRDSSQYNVYENTSPFESSNPSFFNDDGPHDVDLKDISIPSPDEIDLDGINIPNPETIGVKGVSPGHFHDDDVDKEKDEHGDDEGDSDNDKDNDDGDVDEENGDDADNEESKTRKNIDTSLRQPNDQVNLDSERSNTEKHFDISSIPIPEYNEDRMNQIKEKYNIPSANLENLENQGKTNDDDHPDFTRPKDHLIKNEYDDEIPNYKIPKLESSQEQNNDNSENDESQHSYQNNFDQESASPFRPNLNVYTLDNENKQFPFSAEERFRMRNSLKKPEPDHFDEDKSFGYGKFSEEDQRESEFDGFEDGADEKRDPESPLHRFMSPSQHLATLKNVPTNHAGNVVESHIVKQIPIAFKTVIKPVNYGPGYYSPTPQKFHRTQNGIQPPFRPSPQIQNQGRFAGQQAHDHRHTAEYLGHGKFHTQSREQAGRILQPDIVPALEYDISHHFNEPQKQNEHRFQTNIPHYPQAKFNIPQRNTQEDFSNFDSTAKISPQLGTPLSSLESSNNPSGQNIFSDPTKVKSFANMNIHRFNSGGQPVFVPTSPNADNNVNVHHQPSFGLTGNVRPTNANFNVNANGHIYQNQLETPTIPTKSSSSDATQGLVVYHPTKSQMKSVSHVLITPPTVERKQKYNNQPQIQEKNFQYTTTDNGSQKHIKIEIPHLVPQTSQKPTPTQQSDINRFRYLNNYNRQPTNTLQQINKQNRVPLENNRPRNMNPSQNNNNNEFRNIPVRDQNRNGNFRPSIPAPRPTFTLQQIQSIKNSNLPPHIREYNEGNNRPKYDFSQIKNSHSIQKPNEQSNPQHYENSQNAPFEYKSHYSNQHSHKQRPQVTSYNNNENFPYKPQTFGRYNNDNNEPTESDESEEENINNNSEEGEGNDERIRPKDPIHHDTDSKEHYLKNNAQHYFEQKYQTPNDNKEFVQNIKLPQKLPKIIDKLRVTNEFTNVNVNQFNKYHPDNTELHFLPTPTPEMHLIEHKGKAKTLVFTPSQRDPLSNNLELSTPSYTLQDPNIPVHNLESSTMLPPLHFSHNLQSSTISPPHFSTTPSSIPEHPVPLLSPQQFLPPTTPLTPYYTTSIRPEEQSQFIPPEREHFLQIQTPMPTTYEQLQHQLQGHGQSQPQLISHEEPRPQFYFNQQYPFEVPQENQNLNSPPHHQQVLENFVPQQGYVHHSPRPHHIQRLPLGFPSNPDLQNFDPHNPHPNHLQLSQPQVNYPPNLEQFQLSQLAEHPLLEEQQQFFPLQNMNAPGRMVHTIYPHKKSDENHSNEREGNDNFGKESQRYDMDREYSSNVNRYSDNSQERNLDLVSNEESAEHGPSQAGSKNSRTDSKIQFDYVDSKTRIQPHGVNIVGENVKVKESRQGKKQSDEEADNDESSTVSSYIYHEKTSGESYEQNTGSPVNDLVQKYVDNYNKQESKHNEQISEPDVVIQKSLQTEYRLYSQENENTQEENRFVPLNYVTPVPSNSENTNGNTNILNGHIQTFQLSDKNSGNINTNNENPFATKKPEQNSSPQQQQIPYVLNGNAQSFQLPEIHNGKFVDSKKPQINFNTQAHHSPQIQHHHITQHIRGNHNNNVQENKGNTKVNKEYKIAQIVQNGPNFQHHQQLPKSQTFSNGPVNNIGNLLKTNDAPVLLHNRVNTNSASLIFKYSNNAQTQADNSNINPSHYLIRDSDMPTVLLNTGGAINNDKPNVKTYVQFVQPNGNIHQIVQGVVKPEQKIVKTPDIPLVLSPIHFATQTQAQNEKIKIVIPTITEQQNPVQNIHYKLPKSEVIINRFHENVNLTPKPIIVPNVQYLQGPQPFQNKNIMPQTVPFNHQQQILGYQNNFGTLNNNNQNFEFANNIQNNLNNNHNQPVNTLPPHQPIPSQEFINQNIQNFQRNNQNFQMENQNFAQIQSNIHNLQSHQITQNQPIKHIPNNHQHYDIFGEYGQKTQIKEPYRFETPTLNENLKAYLSNPNQFNVYHANNRHNPQTTQVFQPIVLDFDNPNSNFYYKNKYNGIIGGNVKRPEVSDPVKLPSNLVNGVESESIIAKKVKHPSIHDLSSDQSEVSTKTINITGTGLINPHLHNKTSKPTTKRKENNSNEQLTPMMTYLTISQNTNGNQTSFEFNTRDTTSTKNSSNTFHFKNNENNIPILSLSDTKAADKIRDSKNKNTEDIGHPVKNYNINEKKHLEDKIKIELGNKQKPEESYEKMEFLNDNIGTFSSNVEVIQLLPQQISKKSINVKDKTGDIKTQNRENYFDSLNKSYDLIRQSMKIEDDKDKIDISGLYNSDANTINNRTSKQLFHNYVNITRPNPKAQGNNTEPLKDNIPHQKQRQKVYGKTLDINYFNRRKNGLHSNEYAFDEDTTHKLVHDKNDHLNNNYSMRIINLLKNNNTDKSNELNNSLDLNVDKTNEEKNKYSTHNGHGHIFDALDILGSRNKDDIDNELLKILLSSDNISTQSKGKEDEKI
ncbi:hypothetical protein M8J76_009364 [Diaphorina citri]|nr:hypothetical protein M8J76_009364 [Diaphorina citri]